MTPFTLIAEGTNWGTGANLSMEVDKTYFVKNVRSVTIWNEDDETYDTVAFFEEERIGNVSNKMFCGFVTLSLESTAIGSSGTPRYTFYFHSVSYPFTTQKVILDSSIETYDLSRVYLWDSSGKNIEIWQVN